MLGSWRVSFRFFQPSLDIYIYVYINMMDGDVDGSGWIRYDLLDMTHGTLARCLSTGKMYCLGSRWINIEDRSSFQRYGITRVSYQAGRQD